MKFKLLLIITVLLISFYGSSCKKFIEVSAPSTSITSSSAYGEDATAIAVLTGLYAKLSASTPSTPGAIASLSLFPGLSADEFTLWSNSANLAAIAYYRNALSGGVSNYGSEYWSTIYPYIFSCNAAIEGISVSTGLSSPVKQQLLGEASFMRAFFYFYLVNLYGDVPLAVSSDYALNSALARSQSKIVYNQIISDLQTAVNTLSPTYLDATLQNISLDRVRPTKWAAAALLARVYLFTGDWTAAQAQADMVINNTSLFGLSSLKNAFLKASLGNNEAIWQLQPVNTGWNTEEAKSFIMSSAGPGKGFNFGAYLSNRLISSFEPNDQRRYNKNWIDSVVVGGVVYYFPFKYKLNTSGVAASSVSEYPMMLRLGELYLIRAEAKARQGAVSAAAADLNVIRTRAGLLNTTETTQSGMINAILHERQVELFTELGQRWIDLKRVGVVDSVMNIATPLKINGATWNSYQQLYPIRLADIQTDLNLIQNFGY